MQEAHVMMRAMRICFMSLQRFVDKDQEPVKRTETTLDTPSSSWVTP